MHTRSRSEDHPDYQGKRAPVPDHLVAWTEPYENYQPVEFTHKTVSDGPAWADPEDPKKAAFWTRPFTFFLHVDRPVNPVGRTGTSGRGLLGKWGPNQAGDPLVVRKKPYGTGFQMVAIQRANGEWAIPGGMQDNGENILKTLRREFAEEAAGNDLKVTNDILQEPPIILYKGYVDDPRNTDNAWMETTAVLWYVGDLDGFAPKPGVDEIGAKWIDIHYGMQLYADHSLYVNKALKYLERDIEQYMFLIIMVVGVILFFYLL